MSILLFVRLTRFDDDRTEELLLSVAVKLLALLSSAAAQWLPRQGQETIRDLCKAARRFRTDAQRAKKELEPLLGIIPWQYKHSQIRITTQINMTFNEEIATEFPIGTFVDH